MSAFACVFEPNYATRNRPPPLSCWIFTLPKRVQLHIDYTEGHRDPQLLKRAESASSDGPLFRVSSHLALGGRSRSRSGRGSISDRSSASSRAQDWISEYDPRAPMRPECRCGVVGGGGHQPVHQFLARGRAGIHLYHPICECAWVCLAHAANRACNRQADEHDCGPIPAGRRSCASSQYRAGRSHHGRGALVHCGRFNHQHLAIR